MTGNIAAPPRIGALDTLRGVAVLGILLLNILSFGLPFAYELPLVGGATGADLWAWRATSILFEGTMRGLFSLLFGAGIVLLFERVAKREGDHVAVGVHYRRMAWLALFGVVDWLLLLWNGDILFWYGAIGAIVFPLRRLPAGALIAIALGVYAFTSLGAGMEYREARRDHAAAVSAPSAESAAAGPWADRVAEHRKTAAEIAEAVARRRLSNYPALVVANAPEAYDWQIRGFLVYGLLDSAPMMLIGIALLRLGVIAGTRSARLYGAMALGGYALGFAINGYEVALLERGAFAVLPNLQTTITYEFGRLAATLGHLGFVLWLIARGAFPALRDRLAGVGRMAFSNYVLTTVICNAVFLGIGLGLFGQLARHELYYVVAGVWAVLLAWSPWWLARYRMGPLEWLWRLLTYWQRPPMRRAAALS